MEPVAEALSPRKAAVNHKRYLPFGDERVTHTIFYIVPTEDAIREKTDWESLVKATPWLEG